MVSHTNSRLCRQPLGSRRRAYFRGKLLQKRRKHLEYLVGELESMAGTGGRITGDFADIAATSMDRETTFRLGTVETDAVAEIDRALQRIEDGTYGVCEECGERIPQGRLKVLPSAALCVACKRRTELREGADSQFVLDWDGVGEPRGFDSPELESRVGTVRGRRPTGD